MPHITVAVLALLAQRCSTQELAGALGIEASTMYTYIVKLKTKLGCMDLVQFVTWYRQVYGG